MSVFDYLNGKISKEEYLSKDEVPTLITFGRGGFTEYSKAATISGYDHPSEEQFKKLEELKIPYVDMTTTTGGHSVGFPMYTDQPVTEKIHSMSYAPLEVFATLWLHAGAKTNVSPIKLHPKMFSRTPAGAADLLKAWVSNDQIGVAEAMLKAPEEKFAGIIPISTKDGFDKFVSVRDEIIEQMDIWEKEADVFNEKYVESKRADMSLFCEKLGRDGAINESKKSLSILGYWSLWSEAGNGSPEEGLNKAKKEIKSIRDAIRNDFEKHDSDGYEHLRIKWELISQSPMAKIVMDENKRRNRI